MGMTLSTKKLGTKTLRISPEHGIIVTIAHNIQVSHASPLTLFSEKSA